MIINPYYKRQCGFVINEYEMGFGLNLSLNLMIDLEMKGGYIRA